MYVYLGFFAARRARIKSKNFSFNNTNEKDDAPPEEKPVIHVEPNFKIISSKYSNNEKYEMIFIANADGRLKVLDDKKDVLYDEYIYANTKVSINLNLIKGNNLYTYII